MKQFITKISYFSIVMLICMVGMALIHIDDEFVINKTCNTSYEKLAWNLLKIKDAEQLKNADIYIGPSLIQGDVNDSMLNANGIKSVNMGINHNGFDLDHYIVKRVLENAEPGKIYLYRPRDGGSLSHPMMPMLLNPFEYYSIFGQFPLTYIQTYFPKRLYFVMQYLAGFIYTDKQDYQPSKYGFRGEENSVINSMKNDEEAIAEEIAKREDFKEVGINEDGTFYTANTRKKYVRKYLFYYRGAAEPMRTVSVQQIQSKGIPFSEIYMPTYYDAIIDEHTDNRYYFRKPLNYKYDCLTLNNYSFLNDSNLWFDHHHLNSNGSAIFTDSLLAHLK